MTKAYEILLSPLPAEEGGGFIAFVPDLHGCMADGETEEEALANAKDAIAAWCEAQVAAGRKIPEPGAARQELIREEAQIVEALKKQNEIIERLQERIKQLEGVRAVTQATYARVTAWHSQLGPAVISYAKKREIGAV